MESESREEKSRFDGTPREWLRLVKTITSMANTGGGVLLLGTVGCDVTQLDSARVDGRVHSFVAPRIEGLSVDLDMDDTEKSFSVAIHIPDSPSKPHLIRKEGQYQDSEGRHHFEFHSGQVWVRHAASNAPATQDDIDRIFRSRAASLLAQLGTIVLDTPSALLEEASSSGLRFSVSDGHDAVSVNFLFRYTTTELAAALDRKPHWIARAANRLGWRWGPDYDRRYMQAVPGVTGSVIQWRYSEAARRELERTLSQSPDFNPYE